MKTCRAAILKPFAKREFLSVNCKELLPIRMTAKVAVPEANDMRAIHRHGGQAFGKPIDISNALGTTHREVTQNARIGASGPVVGFIRFHLSDSFCYRFRITPSAYSSKQVSPH
jgi:hypothetical protein